MDVTLHPSDTRLTGIISEHGYQGHAHWMMFLFEVTNRVSELPAPTREGRFAFVSRGELDALRLPEPDRERIWPLFWQHRGGFFAASCRCQPGQPNTWTLEESRPGLV